jgi:hypothetical protein
VSTFMKWNKTIARITAVTTLIIALIAAQFIVFASAAPVSACTGEGNGTPTFPSPDPWFDWGQRYINGVMRTGVPVPVAYSYLKGYGNYEPDLIINGEPYKVNIVMAPMPPTYQMGIVSRAYLKSVGNPQTLHWYMRGSWDPSMSLPGTIFDSDLLNFEYPLYLGKTWSATTTITPYPNVQLPVTTEAVVAAYIEPVLDGSGAVTTYNVIAAEGCEYQLPDLNSNGILGDDVSAIPLPRTELGDMSWNDMKAISESDARIDWNDVTVPAGPYRGQNIQGYYVVQQTITTGPQGSPISTTTMEAWKDVRGCIPVQIVERGQMSSSGWTTQTTMTIAQRWTGNFQWFEYEFGGPAKTLKIRIEDTAIGEGGHTFQFTTTGKDFGVKYAGDAMNVDLENGRILINYQDAYMTCNGRMIRICDDTWVGYARIKDLETNRTYIVAGITMDR